MLVVITIKSARWAVPDVDCQAILQGKLVLMPEGDALTGLKADHQEAVRGGMFFETPDEFEEIVQRLKTAEEKINEVVVQKYFYQLFIGLNYQRALQIANSSQNSFEEIDNIALLLNIQMQLNPEYIS